MTDLSKFKPNLFSVIVQRYIEKVTGTKYIAEQCYDYFELLMYSKERISQLDFEEIFKYAKRVESRFDRRFNFKYLNEDGLKGLYLSHEVKCECPLCKHVEENYPELKLEAISTIYDR